MTTAHTREEWDRATSVARAAAIMAGMPLTDEDEAALRRVETGQSTTEEEIAAAREHVLARQRHATA